MLKAFNMDDLFQTEWQGFQEFLAEETQEDNDETPDPATDVLDLEAADDESSPEYEDDDLPFYRPKHLSCVAHTLQLVVNDGLKSDIAALEVSRYLDKLTAFFSRRTHWRAEFKKVAEKDLVKPVKTRWNSLFFGLKRLCEVIVGKSLCL
jgi:hypothetical protein